MAASTIGVSSQTKRSLAAAKPPEMAWDAFMVSLLEATDTNRFMEIVESQRGESEEEAVDKARQRYMKYRKGPDALLSGTELRRRIHVRRLLESLSRFHGSLKLATVGPSRGDEKALRELLEELDEQVHDARALLAA